jgi:hypothetical protein
MSKGRMRHDEQRRAVERAYRRAMRRGNDLDAVWLGSIVTTGRTV